MRRMLFDQIKVLPYAAGEAIDRDGALSVVLGVTCSAATATPTLAVTLETSDTADGTYTAVSDERAIVSDMPVALETEGTYMIKLDVLGCKRYVRITPTINGTATCAYAVAIGDLANNPPA